MNDLNQGSSALVPRQTTITDSGGGSAIQFSALAEALKQGLKEAAAHQDVLLDYPELARRLKLGIRATKDLVNRGRITPALRYGNIARFHWPSVLEELRHHPLR